jgi:hypothetical protein
MAPPVRRGHFFAAAGSDIHRLSTATVDWWMDFAGSAQYVDKAVDRLLMRG